MSIRNLPGSNRWSAHKADLTATCEPIVLKNMETSTPHYAMGLYELLHGVLYLFNHFNV
jgi:hypothetical protein